MNIEAQSFIAQKEAINFSKQEYKGGAQNWKIKQDAEGRIYFANNEGALVFDGTYWKLYPLPNKTIVRSIEFGKDNRLYAGGQDEMGYYSPDKTGNLSYTSLKTLLPESERSFSDVWNIVRFGDDIFFRSNYKILRYTNGRIIIHPPLSTWLFLGLNQNQLIAHDERAGIMVYNNGRWDLLVGREQLPEGFYMTSINPIGQDSSLITTSAGLFLLSNRKLSRFEIKTAGFDNNQNFSDAVQLDNGEFLVSTYNHGVFHINKKGIVIESYSKKEGLQNSNVRSLFRDKDKNIWLGLDNGISFIAYNNAFTHVNPAEFNDASGYSVAVYNNNIYFALSNGIYVTPLDTSVNDLSFTPNRLKPVTSGQAWRLAAVGDKLFAARDNGFYMVSGTTLIPISGETGYWVFKLYKKDSVTNFIVTGNYNGVTIFNQKEDGSVGNRVFTKEIGSSRFLTIDKGIIWVSHPYRGVYRINVDNNSSVLYTAENGLPSTLNNHIYRVKNKIVVGTEKGVYEYDSAAKRFIPSAFYLPIFGKTSIRYLKEDNKGNIWFVHEKSLGVVDLSTGSPQLVYLPELEGRILSGFEDVYCMDERNIFIAGENGFYHVNFEKYKEGIHSFSVFIRAVHSISQRDSLIYGGYAPDSGSAKRPTPELSYKWNSFHFEYSSSLYEQRSNIEYSYFLKGFDDTWSDWSKKTEKDYTKLPPGDYTFMVKARNNLNNETPTSSYSFRISPPWYLSMAAKVVYLLLTVLAAVLLYKWQAKRHAAREERKFLEERKKMEEEQKKMAYQHQLEIEKSEKELMHLQNEKLENEIGHKNTELASTAMNLVQKKEFILKIKEELQYLVRHNKEKIETRDLKKVFGILSDEENLNEEWEQFSVHFDKVHGDFLVMLKEKYPDLKPHELKLCAYLRMNLSSKEIAQLMGISVRGVEISRYRLRKKLSIPTEVNLFQFLFDIQSKEK